MRTEIIFVLLVVLLIIGLTAFRYRKQIATMIGVARMLKQARQAAKQGTKAFEADEPKPNTLVNCGKCDVWVPQAKAVKFRQGFICSTVCQKAETTAKTVQN